MTEQILEVIFKKRVDIPYLAQCQNFSEYNCFRVEKYRLTNKEFIRIKKGVEFYETK